MERGRRKRKKVRGEAVLLALPALLVYSCVIIYPIFNMLATSFFEWNGVPDSPRQFVRLANYQNFFTDYAAAYAIKNIAILMAAGLFCTIPIAFSWQRSSTGPFAGNGCSGWCISCRC